MLTAEASLGMVLAPGDKGPLQWHLGSMLGGQQQECPLQSLSRCPGVASTAAPGSSPGPGYSLVATPPRAQLSLDEAPQSSPDNPKRLVYTVGSGPHHHSPCKCACRCPSVQYTTGSFRVAQVVSAPAVPHHKPLMQGVRGGGCH